MGMRAGQATLCCFLNRISDLGIRAGLSFGLRIDLRTDQDDIGGHEQPELKTTTAPREP